MTQPLSGLRVAELAEGVAGPYAGKLLADFGADVVKVERPDGDPSRRLGPFPASDGAAAIDLEQSALFLHLNTNKRSVVADGGPPAGSLVEDLMGWADLVIQSRPEPAPPQLRARHPRLVVTSVTSFGLTGPYAGYRGEEIVHYAFGGPMSATGAADREPLKMGGAIGQYQCGAVAAVASLAGLMLADRGRGVHIDLANVETQIGSIDRRMTYLLYAAYRGEDVDRRAGYNLGPLPNGCRPTLDGHIQISTLMNWIPRMLAVVDNPDLAALYEDPGFILDETVPELADAHLLGWSLTKTRQEAMEEAQAAGWPITAVNRPVDLLTDHHFAERRFFVPVEHPVSGTLRQPGAPVRMEDGWRLRRPAPTLGQHTEEVAAELATANSGAQSRPGPEADGSADRLPLDGIRILDLTVVWAGPYATCILGDLGAEIIRVDNPHVFPSATRGMMARPPKELIDDVGGIFGGYPDAEPGVRPWNRIALFNAHARNKRSITLDLRKGAGREVFLRLAERCDVMVENNSVDLLAKLGLDWDALRARNPRLILLRMPSVGLDGPYRDYLGFGVNFEGLCGLTAIRGYADVDLSEGETVYHMDAASGSAGALSVLMALRRRESTGVGEMIELSQSENMLAHIGELLIDAERTGREHVPLGNRHHARFPQGCYRCSGDDTDADDWVVISVGDDEEWAGLGRAAGSPEWAADGRFATPEGRRDHHDELDELIGGWTAGLSSHEVFLACQAEGVPAAPVLHEREAFADPHLAARGVFRPNGNEEIGTHAYPGHLWRWDGPELAWGPLPVLGGDNRAVLQDIVGLTDEEYAALEADGHLSLDYLDSEGNPF